ncbi:MAG: carboxypeptidase-like regulatory domain-containing protein [Chloroflexota bacterium]
MIKTEYSSRSKRWLMLALLFLPLLLVFGATAVALVSAQAGLITGSVTDPDGGTPPDGTTIQLVGPSDLLFGTADVGADGRFSLGPVPNGTYALRAVPPATTEFTLSLPHSLLLRGDAVDVGTIALTHPSVIGMVYAPDGVTPVAANVQVYKNGHRVLNVPTADDGSYKLGGLPDKSYTIQAIPTSDEPHWKSARLSVEIDGDAAQTIDLTLRDANVVGIVTDPQGNPIAGATVYAAGRETDTHRRDVTSESGYFAIGALPDDSYHLVADPPYHRGGLAHSAPVSFAVPPEFTDLGEIALRDAPKIVEGTVKTNLNVPVENGLVLATRRDRPGEQRALTDAAGNYMLNLGPGLWALTVRHTDASDPSNWRYNDRPQLVHFDYDFEPELKRAHFEVLTADSTITGIVTMPDGSVPPFPVKMGLRNNEGLGRHVLIDPVDGSFSLMVRHGNYVLGVEPDDAAFEGPRPQRVHAPANDTVDVGAIALVEKDATLSGMVVDSSGEGVGGVVVVAWAPHRHPDSDHRHTHDYRTARTVTNDDGSYLLAVTAGTWKIRPHVPHTLPYIFTGEVLTAVIEPMQDITELDFELTDANNTLNGQLVDPSGEPVMVQGRVTVSQGERPLTGAPIEGGSFTVLLPDGDYKLHVNLGPDSEWLVGKPLEGMIGGGETVSVDIPVRPKDATIAGALWDPREEQVVTGVRGQVLATNPYSWVSDAINPNNGTYTLDVAAGLWHLGYEVAPRSGYVVLDHHQIIPIESEQSLAVPLPVTKRDGLLEGMVLAPDGSPLAGAAVVAEGQGRLLEQVTLRTHTDDNGRFALHVPHGPYRVRAAYDNDAWLNPVVQTRAVAKDGRLANITLQFRESDVTLSGLTTLESDDVVDGRVHIWAYNKDGAATKTVVALGEEYELGLLSNSRWHIGAALETADSFYALRTVVAMGDDNQTLDLALKGPFTKPAPLAVTFDSQEAQHVELGDGTQIYIPAGAMPVDGSVTLHITPISTLPHQHHARLYKYGYAFIATDEAGAPITSSFNQDVVIRFKYTQQELAELGLREGRLKPAYFSTTTQSWTVPDSYVVDTDNNWVVMQIDHFTDFSLLNGAETFTTFLPAVSK